MKAYTKDMPPPDLKKDHLGYLPPEGNFHTRIFGRPGNILNCYGQFVANLINLCLYAQKFDIQGNTRANFVPSKIDTPNTKYAVVTLNYDLVIENCIDYLTKYFCENYPQQISNINTLQIAKLHGSVDSEIVAPTWKKWAVGDLQVQWQTAHQLLSEANHIRIVGYSLPVSDLYVRYLLSSAVLSSKHLKCIDVICLDDDNGTTNERYSEFITFKFFRFKNAKIEEYIDTSRDEHALGMTTRSSRTDDRWWAEYNRLERLHEDFLSH